MRTVSQVEILRLLIEAGNRPPQWVVDIVSNSGTLVPDDVPLSSSNPTNPVGIRSANTDTIWE